MVEKFLVLGEALTDCVVRGGTVGETAGGSPMNVAVGLGRLKRDVTLATRFGPDLLHAARGRSRKKIATKRLCCACECVPVCFLF